MKKCKKCSKMLRALTDNSDKPDKIREKKIEVLLIILAVGLEFQIKVVLLCNNLQYQN
jgi:hypothetical protein